jgi:hypothetical protein
VAVAERALTVQAAAHLLVVTVVAAVVLESQVRALAPGFLGKALPGALRKIMGLMTDVVAVAVVATLLEIY